jgi:hypothetical protein
MHPYRTIRIEFVRREDRPIWFKRSSVKRQVRRSLKRADRARSRRQEEF